MTLNINFSVKPKQRGTRESTVACCRRLNSPSLCDASRRYFFTTDGQERGRSFARQGKGNEEFNEIKTDRVTLQI